MADDKDKKNWNQLQGKETRDQVKSNAGKSIRDWRAGRGSR
jgi:hypothetical protein